MPASRRIRPAALTRSPAFHGSPDDRGGLSARIVGLLLALPAAALAAAILLPAHLPFVDFPQHVALASIWARLDRADPTVVGLYQVNVGTPYLTGDALSHLLQPLVGPEMAVRIVLLVALTAVPLAALVVLRAYGRPPELAIAAFAVAFAWVTFMGFVPWLAAVPMIVLAPAAVRWLDASRWAWPVLATLAFAVFATHALALPVFGLLAVAATLGLPDSRHRLGRVLAALAPAVAVAAVWAIGRAHLASPDPRRFEFGSPLARLSVARYVFGESGPDNRVLLVGLGLGGLAAVAAWLVWRTRHIAGPGRPAPVRAAAGVRRVTDHLRDRPLVWPVLAAAVAYAVAPTTALDAYGLWQRMAPIAFVIGLGLVPWPAPGRQRLVLAVGLSVVATYASLSTLGLSAAFDRQVAGLDTVLTQLPRGQRLFYEQPTTPAAGVGVPALRHLSAVYLADGGADIDYNFAMFPHMVVRLSEPRVLLSEPTTYAYDLRLGPCPSEGGLPLGAEIARAGEWHVFQVQGPMVRPPERSVDASSPPASC